MIFQTNFLILLIILLAFVSNVESTTQKSSTYKISKLPTKKGKSFANSVINNNLAKNGIKNSTNKEKAFKSWAKHFNKSYKNYVKSESEAVQDFWTNYNNIRIHNLRSNETYQRDLQVHSDLTLDEKKAYRMGLNIELIERDALPMPAIPITPRKNRVNYTELFPPAKDQGYCGACWAFTSVSVLEYTSRKNNGNEIYSEQCLIDCDFGDGGCDGKFCGWPGNALAYVRDYGISDGSLYVYKAYNDTCQKDIFPSIFTIDNVCTYDLYGDEEKLRQLVDISPVIVCIGTTDGFTSYRRGIFYDKLCPSNEVDHALTVVGYGSEGKGRDYWIIRNSWGIYWGMKGYGLMARNKNNHCGIASYAIVVC